MTDICRRICITGMRTNTTEKNAKIKHTEIMIYENNGYFLLRLACMLILTFCSRIPGPPNIQTNIKFNI